MVHPKGVSESRFHPYREGPLELGAALGGGAFAEVRVARTSDAREVAVKIARVTPLFDDGATNAVFASRPIAFHTGSIGAWDPDPDEVLAAEATWLRRARHPAFVKVLGESSIDGRRALVLERIRGSTWRAALLTGQRPGLDAVLAVARALADDGARHGDIKPENLMLEPGGAVRVLDPSAGAEDASRRITTRVYNPSLELSDVPSLGLLAFETLTGVQPCLSLALGSAPPSLAGLFQSLDAKLAELGSRLASVVLRSVGLARRGRTIEPSEGFAGVRAMLAALDDIPRA